MKPMRNINIDQGWTFTKGLFETMRQPKDAEVVDLPHDYMIASDPTPDAPAGPASGFYTALTASYSKRLAIPAEWEGEQIGLQFDGAMMNATIEVNGCKAGLQHYGYAPFFVDISQYVYCGDENLIVITVNPSMQPNCRWYSGAGIFRSLELVHTPAVCLANNGIYACTRNIEYAEDGSPETAYLQVQADVENHTVKNHLAKVTFSLIDDQTGECVIRRCAKVQVNPGKTQTAYMTLTVSSPKLWSAETPNLYRLTAKVTDEALFKTHIIENQDLTEDDDSVLFGIRTIAADVKHGLRINGKTVKLKGGCVHHDNGILGAVSLYDTEARRVRNLKALGFNAIRTTHNPPSAALIEACDRLGMYVFDEAFDAWGIAKQPGDYNQFFDTDWEKDLSAFVCRDRSHPAVIIWSNGNEIVERGGLNNGYTLAARLAEKIHSLDSSRPVSNGVCSFWCGLDAPMMKAQTERLEARLNGAAGGVQNADVGTADLTWEQYTEAFVNGLDIVGYNYLEDKYPQDHEMFPERVILGSENYPKEIGYRWPMVESTPYVIGDFTWTACDYIGEAGIGKAAYVDADNPLVKAGSFGLMSHTSVYPWRLANDADLDINGNMLPQGAYRSIVWGSEKTFLYSYDPAVFGKTEILSMWGFPDLYKHWNWAGKEGHMVSLMVFSLGDEAELIVNGKSLGKKAVSTERPFPRSVIFDTIYEAGQVTAISYRGGVEISRDTIKTTGCPAALRAAAEQDSLPADGHGVCYVNLEVIDADGNFIPDAAVTVTVETEGPARLAGMGSGNPVTAENYTGKSITTYKGRLTAAIRSTCKEGATTITFRAEGLGETSVTIQVRGCLSDRSDDLCQL